jgi:hypothetical protein
MLNREGGQELGYPNVLTLPKEVIQPQQIATMTIPQFSTKSKAKGQNYTSPIAPLELSNNFTIHRAISSNAPISCI